MVEEHKDGRNTPAYRLEIISRTIPKKEAVVCGDRRITWQELTNRAHSLANAFLDFGAGRTGPVGIMDYNSVESYETIFASTYVAAPVANVNFRYVSSNEISHIINNSGCSVLVLNEDFADRIDGIRSDLKTVKKYIVIGRSFPENMTGYDELIKEYPKVMPKLDEPAKNDDVFFHLYTGGTTGMPKGVVVPYTAVFNHLIPVAFRFAMQAMNRITYAPEDVFRSIGSMVGTPQIAPVLHRVVSNDLTRSLLDLPSIKKLLPPILDRLLWTPEFMHPLLALVAGGRLKMLSLSPVTHAWGLAMTFVPALLGAVNVIPTSKSLNGEEALELIEKERINLTTTVGDAYAKEIADILERTRYDLSSLFVVINGGAKFSTKYKKIWFKHMPGLIIADALASTEGFGIAASLYTAGDEDIGDDYFTAAPELVRVIDPETGKDVKLGEVGILYQEGEYHRAGYFKADEKTKETWKTIDGKHWTCIGDYATLDEKGGITILGRGSECINTGGEKVFPPEVEEVVKTHPKVENAGVLGVPDEKWGEAVTVAVQLREGEKSTDKEVIDFCRGKIAGYKIPKHVIFVDEIPRTAIEKISYRKLKEIVRGKTNLFG